MASAARLGQTTVYGNGNQDFAGGTPGLVPAAAPASSTTRRRAADSTHHVRISLANAPPGTRMAVDGTGPATVKTETQFASSLVREFEISGFIYRIHRRPG